MFQKETVILYYNTLIYYTVWRFIYFRGYNILAYFGLVNTSAKKKNPPILICYILFIGKLLSLSRKYKTLDIHINVSHAKIAKI